MEDRIIGGAYLSVRYNVQVFEDEFYFKKFTLNFSLRKIPMQKVHPLLCSFGGGGWKSWEIIGYSFRNQFLTKIA